MSDFIIGTPFLPQPAKVDLLMAVGEGMSLFSEEIAVDLGDDSIPIRATLKANKCIYLGLYPVVIFLRAGRSDIEKIGKADDLPQKLQKFRLPVLERVAHHLVQPIGQLRNLAVRVAVGKIGPPAEPPVQCQRYQKESPGQPSIGIFPEYPLGFSPRVPSGHFRLRDGMDAAWTVERGWELMVPAPTMGAVRQVPRSNQVEVAPPFLPERPAGTCEHRRDGGKRTAMTSSPGEKIMSATPNRKMRSWLFAPGDSARKMAKAQASEADIVILDLEDAVAPENKPLARTMIYDVLKAADEASRHRLFVRINPLDGPHTLADLAAIIPGQPGGIMLPKSSGRGDVERLDHYLSALEVANGIAEGTTPVIVLVTETAAAMFSTGDYRGAPRVIALTWGAEDLADSIGASRNRNPDGSYGYTYELARSLCLLGAAAAEVTPIDTVEPDFRNTDALRLRAETVRRQGYRGMLAIHPDQVPVINAAFTPGEAEIADAREVVALFAANPGAGTIGHKGGMLDRPHLSRAQQLLAQVGET